MRINKTVKSKSDFKKFISDMKSPILKEFSSNSDWLNLSFVIFDDEDPINRFMTNSVIFNHKTESIEQYNIREQKFREKINKWLNE